MKILLATLLAGAVVGQTVAIARPAAPDARPMTHLTNATVMEVVRAQIGSGVIMFLHRVTVRTDDLQTRDLFAISMDPASDALPPVGAVCDFGLSELRADSGVGDRVPPHKPIPQIVSHTCNVPDDWQFGTPTVEDQQPGR